MTLEEMRKGTDTIVQGSLSDGRWFGDRTSCTASKRRARLGRGRTRSLIPSSRGKPRRGRSCSSGLYSEMLAVAQGARPEHFYVVTPDRRLARRHVSRRRLCRVLPTRSRPMIDTVARQHDDGRGGRTIPIPSTIVRSVIGSANCRDRRRADDHLSLVAGITRAQRRELEARSVGTLTSLAGIPVPLTFKPRRGSVETYVRVREQARVAAGVAREASAAPRAAAGRGRERTVPTPGAVARAISFSISRAIQYAVEGGREYLFGAAPPPTAATNPRGRSPTAKSDADSSG